MLNGSDTTPRKDSDTIVDIEGGLYYTEADLSAWIREQSQARKQFLEGNPSPITANQIKVLDSLSFPWILDSSERWDKHFRELVEFKLQNGHCDVPNRMGKLGTWIKNQRAAYRRLYGADAESGGGAKGTTAKITRDQVQLLSELGFQWSVKNKYTASWHNQFERLLNFVREKGHCKVERKENLALAQWISDQRTEYRRRAAGEKSLMTEERIALLEGIEGFMWEGRIRKTEEEKAEAKRKKLERRRESRKKRKEEDMRKQIEAAEKMERERKENMTMSEEEAEAMEKQREKWAEAKAITKQKEEKKRKKMEEAAAKKKAAQQKRQQKKRKSEEAKRLKREAEAAAVIVNIPPRPVVPIACPRPMETFQVELQPQRNTNAGMTFLEAQKNIQMDREISLLAQKDHRGLPLSTKVNDAAVTGNIHSMPEATKRARAAAGYISNEINIAAATASVPPRPDGPPATNVEATSGTLVARSDASNEAKPVMVAVNTLLLPTGPTSDKNAIARAREKAGYTLPANLTE